MGSWSLQVYMAQIWYQRLSVVDNEHRQNTYKYLRPWFQHASIEPIIILNEFPELTFICYLPIQSPAVARESTAIITPPLNLKPKVVVPWLKWILGPPSLALTEFINSAVYKYIECSASLITN